jgi:uncharacterized Ntn-hydrolase superfamily protein
MTFSLLAVDEQTGALGAAAATGNLCVGAWVLRGDSRFGLTASQGRMPSTLWGEDALGLLAHGAGAEEAVAQTVSDDTGRSARQLAALGRGGPPAAFHGEDNLPFTGHVAGETWIVTGNWLSSPDVIERAAEALSATRGEFAERLIAALRAGIAAGSDRRGTLSAALMILAEDAAPLDLRVDFDAAPVDRLAALLERTRAPDYRDWLARLPTRQEPEKA